jgi:hypothetical protein
MLTAEAVERVDISTALSAIHGRSATVVTERMPRALD